MCYLQPKVWTAPELALARAVVEAVTLLRDNPPEWMVADLKLQGITLDRNTLQVVLDVLDQKLGLS